MDSRIISGIMGHKVPVQTEVLASGTEDKEETRYAIV